MRRKRCERCDWLPGTFLGTWAYSLLTVLPRILLPRDADLVNPFLFEVGSRTNMANGLERTSNGLILKKGLEQPSHTLRQRHQDWNQSKVHPFTCLLSTYQ